MGDVLGAVTTYDGRLHEAPTDAGLGVVAPH
jgi:hypothetical protein